MSDTNIKDTGELLEEIKRDATSKATLSEVKSTAKDTGSGSQEQAPAPDGQFDETPEEGDPRKSGDPM